jgi:hypothetical protein
LKHGNWSFRGPAENQPSPSRHHGGGAGAGPLHYRSELVERIRAGGGVLSAGELTVKLAKEFGFCYGVERAIDLAYAAKKHFSEVSPHTPIYLLGEIIHNPK